MNSFELFRRNPANPIITAADWPGPVNVVFNPAAVQLGDETILLARVEARTGISHIAVARSDDGVGGWRIDPEPLLAPVDDDGERWGLEDPRTVWVEELGTHVISCTAYGPAGPAVFLATSDDFHSVERLGIVLAPRIRTRHSSRNASAANGSCSTAPRRTSATVTRASRSRAHRT